LWRGPRVVCAAGCRLVRAGLGGLRVWLVSGQQQPPGGCSGMRLAAAIKALRRVSRTRPNDALFRVSRFQ
jgi:hypothetical protein